MCLLEYPLSVSSAWVSQCSNVWSSKFYYFFEPSSNKFVLLLMYNTSGSVFICLCFICFGAFLNPYWCLLNFAVKVANYRGFQKLGKLLASHYVTEISFEYLILLKVRVLLKSAIIRMFTHQTTARATATVAFHPRFLTVWSCDSCNGGLAPWYRSP